jgi:hypothetical protein
MLPRALAVCYRSWCLKSGVSLANCQHSSSFISVRNWRQWMRYLILKARVVGSIPTSCSTSDH